MDEKTHGIVDALVSAGLVQASDRDRAADVVAAAAGGPAAAPRVSSNLGEIAGYAGAALVVAAGVILIAEQWSSIGVQMRVAWIAGMGIVLAIAGIVASFLGTGFPALREESGAVRRRLAGTFYTGTAISVAVAVGVEVAHMRDTAARSFSGSWVLLAVFGALALVGLLGYLAAPTMVGLLPIAIGTVVTVTAVVGLFNLEREAQATTQSLLWIALALLWWGLSEIDAIPRQFGLAIALVIGLIAGQVPALDEAARGFGYTLTTLVAVGAFVGYVLRPAWAYLGAGVVALTLVVPEALNHWTAGSIGIAGAVLLAGVTLLATSLLSFKLHRGSGDRASRRVQSSSEA